MRLKFMNIKSEKQQTIMETIANKAEENERIFQEASIQASYTCPMPMEIIKVFNSVIATLGNFSLSTGKTKTKQSIKQIKTTELLGNAEGAEPRHIIAGGGNVYFTTYGGYVAAVDTTSFALHHS